MNNGHQFLILDLIGTVRRAMLGGEEYQTSAKYKIVKILSLLIFLLIPKIVSTKDFLLLPSAPGASYRLHRLEAGLGVS